MTRNALAILLFASACSAQSSDGDICEAGKCDGPFLDQLNGREDPIGKFFKQLGDAKVIDAKGIYSFTKAKTIAPTGEKLFYAKLVAGLAQVQGCDPNALINYTLSDDLITGDPKDVFPRIVSTVCSNDADKVTNAFIATVGTPTDDGDMSLDDLEMFAWDPVASKYRFYAVNPTADGKLRVEVEPARCAECHLTPRDDDNFGMPRLPIMNELTKPWTHWNPGAGSVAESFQIPEAIKDKPNFKRFGIEAVGAASRLEKVIRDANAQRVTPARAKGLFRPANIDEAMGLIRPLFCDEQVNYVSELATGEISMDAVVAGGIKNAYRAINPTWSFPWFNNDIVRLQQAEGDVAVFMVPVRGVADLTFEPQLQNILSPNHILAIRALDWKRPALSEFRCGLWRNARKAFASNPPKLTGRNRDAIKVLYDEIMKLGGMSTRNIAAGKFVVMDLASDSTVQKVKDGIAAGTIPTTCREGAGNFCETDANGFGDLLQKYVDLAESASRAQLLEERDRRVCNVVNEVEPAESNKQFGSGIRVANHPSFFNLPTSGAAGFDAVPTGCNTEAPRPQNAPTSVIPQ